MWNFHHFYNSILIYCISFIDGEIILEYVPPQQHILILKVLFQIKNSCPVWLDFVLNLPNGNITSYCQIFSSDNLIEMIEFDWIERTIYANDQYKHSGTVESEWNISNKTVVIADMFTNDCKPWLKNSKNPPDMIIKPGPHYWL